ncbi:MAG: portal protein [Candidatus Peribacteraceae bacterium]|nr:portal protein [Candidatus Peribacteraceae bacterium]
MAKNKKDSRNGIQGAFDAIRNKLSKASFTKSLDQVDDIIDRVSDSVMNKDSMNYAEMVRGIFTDSIQTDMFKDVSSNIMLSHETYSRLVRYANAEEICDAVPYCARALKVISDEIVAPDHITKEILQFLQEKHLSAKETDSLTKIKAINRTLELEDNLHELVYETLKLGDQFVEVCDYMSKEIPVTQSLLQESGIDGLEDLLDDDGNSIVDQTYEVKIKQPGLNEFGKQTMFETTKLITPVLIEDEIVDEKPKKGRGKNKPAVDIERIRLLMHDPRFVIKLQSQRYKMSLGYLVLPRPSSQYASAMNVGHQSAATNSLMNSPGKDFSGVDKIYSDIMKMVKKHIGSNELSVDKKEVLDVIKRAIEEFDMEEQNTFKIRFVPPERMEHWVLSSRRFFPYGEGIFHKNTFSAKLLIAFETALVVKRIADSSDKRIMYIESGLPRHTRNLIEEIKEAMKKRKFSVDTMGNIGSIPSMITSYEEYYVPQSKGKRYVEFDSLPPTTNWRDISDELKLFRDFLVSALEVPPSYINLEENLSNKAALSFENILFARTIVAYQTKLTKHINGLFSKIYKMIYKEPIPTGINITFSPPKMLLLEKETEQMEMVSRLVSSMKELGINEEYLKRKYMNVDWEELEEYENKAKLDEKSKPKPEDDMGGMQF